MMNLSDNGLKLIKEFEGFRTNAYRSEERRVVCRSLDWYLSQYLDKY